MAAAARITQGLALERIESDMYRAPRELLWVPVGGRGEGGAVALLLLITAADTTFLFLLQGSTAANLSDRLYMQQSAPYQTTTRRTRFT